MFHEVTKTDGVKIILNESAIMFAQECQLSNAKGDTIDGYTISLSNGTKVQICKDAASKKVFSKKGFFS